MIDINVVALQPIINSQLLTNMKKPLYKNPKIMILTHRKVQRLDILLGNPERAIKRICYVLRRVYFSGSKTRFR